ncbi:MAG: hypothetical protein JNM27_14355 [Leptospirales bacterium]|nr:hypothetical protein [Leptospirales bacterium]
MKKLIVFLVLGILPAGISAQVLDPTVYNNVRDFLSQIRHPEEVDMIGGVRAIAPVNTEGYLMAIADSTVLPAAPKLRAFALLSYFPQSQAVRNFLDARMGDGSVNETYRQMAMTSFVRGFYSADPVGVSNSLQRCTNDGSPFVREHAKGMLSRAKSGVKAPAGENPGKAHKPHKHKDGDS